MSIHIALPQCDDLLVMEVLKKMLGFTDTDYCELTRPDGAIATYGPCDPPETR